MNYVPAPAKVVAPSAPETWTSVQPEFITYHLFDGEEIIGWRALTERRGGHTWITGYQVVTTDGIYELDNWGTCYRSSALHKVVK